MHVKLVLAALGLSAFVAAQSVDDLPQACSSICQSVISLTADCDRQTDDDGDGFIRCVCGYNNAATLVLQCASCVVQNDPNDGDDNDVSDLVRRCNFAASSGSIIPATTTAPTNTASRASSASPAGSTCVDYDDGDDRCEQWAPVATSAPIGSATSSATTGGTSTCIDFDDGEDRCDQLSYIAGSTTSRFTTPSNNVGSPTTAAAAPSSTCVDYDDGEDRCDRWSTISGAATPTVPAPTGVAVLTTCVDYDDGDDRCDRYSTFTSTGAAGSTGSVITTSVSGTIVTSTRASVSGTVTATPAQQTTNAAIGKYVPMAGAFGGVVLAAGLL